MKKVISSIKNAKKILGVLCLGYLLSSCQQPLQDAQLSDLPKDSVDTIQSELVTAGPMPLFVLQKWGTKSGNAEITWLLHSDHKKIAIPTSVSILTGVDKHYEFKPVFLSSDTFPDTAIIKKGGTGSHHTEVHILSRSGSSFLLHAATPLPETDENVAFDFADWDADGVPDLVAIFKGGVAGIDKTAFQIFSGATNFSTQLQGPTPTALEKTDGQFQFTMTDWDLDGKPDLAAVKKGPTGSGKVEVHIFSGISNFTVPILQTPTAFDAFDDLSHFELVDQDWDGTFDLAAVKKKNTGTKSTELFILSGASSFKTMILATGTAIPETDDSYTFSFPKRPKWKTIEILNETYKYGYAPGYLPIGGDGYEDFYINLPNYARYDNYTLDVNYRSLDGRKTSYANIVEAPPVGQRGGRLHFKVRWWYNDWSEVSYKLIVTAKSYSGLLKTSIKQKLPAPPAPPPGPPTPPPTSSGVHAVVLSNTSVDTQAIWSQNVYSGNYILVGTLGPSLTTILTIPAGQSYRLLSISPRQLDAYNRSHGTYYSATDSSTISILSALSLYSWQAGIFLGNDAGGYVSATIISPSF